MSVHETVEKEAAFYDSAAARVTINDEVAKRYIAYDSPIGWGGDCLPHMKQSLLQTMGDVRGKRVLVYGCGNDGAAVWFAGSGAKVDAIDVSPKSIENQRQIAERLKLVINAVLMDAHRLTLPAEEYDIVYGNAVLHHLNLEKAVSEMTRVLKAGGKGVFREVQSGNIFLRAFRRATPFWRTPDEHPLTRKDFALLAEKFSTCQVTEYGLSGLPYLFFYRMANRFILKRLRVAIPMSVHSLLYRNFDRLDRALFRIFPVLKSQAWLCLIIVAKQ